MSLSVPLIHLSRILKHLTFIISIFWRLFFKNINIYTLVLSHTLSFLPICKHLYPRVCQSFSFSLYPSLSVPSHSLILSVSYSLTSFLTLYSSLRLFLYISLYLSLSLSLLLSLCLSLLPSLSLTLLLSIPLSASFSITL